MKFHKDELAALLACVAIAGNLFIWSASARSHTDERENDWHTAVEARLTRLETKMDRLLNVNQAAIDFARERLPKTR